VNVCKHIGILFLQIPRCYYHPFINPIVNPADILPVNGIPKLVVANEEAVTAAWLSLTVPPLIIGICIVRFASVVIG
jgi:hypothetical protein